MERFQYHFRDFELSKKYVLNTIPYYRKKLKSVIWTKFSPFQKHTGETKEAIISIPTSNQITNVKTNDYFVVYK